MVRSQLLYLIRQNKDKYNLYITDEMAKKENKVVLRLPPYHCELNPIELIWAQVKNEVASKNKTYKLKDVRELLIEALNNVTNMNWKKCVEHVIKEEEKMGTLDGIMDDLIEPLIISINNSESDMDTDSSNNSENC
uniref:Tc1-like transposase DDE domain-containing protein n=2 Tax=Anoplophora glabripennis TaxID=217634 RepID=V5GTA9_ANOGL